MTTLANVLRTQLSRDPGRPLVTFYDEATGERVELSVVTYANWVAKLSSLYDELGLERGMTLRIDLPVHWLTPVVLGAAWNVGLVVSDTDTPDAAVVGPDGLERYDPRRVVVLASALLPMGVRFREAVPADVHDLGIEVWSQPDSFVPFDPPGPGDAAFAWGASATSQAQMWETAAASQDSGRLLVEANPASPPGIASFTGPLAGGGSVVLVTHADPDRLEAIAVAERVTDRFPRGGDQSLHPARS